MWGISKISDLHEITEISKHSDVYEIWNMEFDRISDLLGVNPTYHQWCVNDLAIAEKQLWLNFSTFCTKCI